MDSAFEKKDGKLSRVVQVEGLIGLARHFETKSFTHHAVERVSVLSVHLLLNQFAGRLNTVIKLNAAFPL